MADPQGFTLVELLVVMVVMSIIAGAISAVAVSMLRTQSQVTEMSDVMGEARAGLVRMQTELRETKRLYPDDDPNEPCDPRSMTAWVDRDRDGLLQNDELVTFALVENDEGTARLERWTQEDPTRRTTVARYIAAADVFRCTDEPPNTRVLDIEVTVVGPRGLHTTELNGSVRLRNVD